MGSTYGTQLLDFLGLLGGWANVQLEDGALRLVCGYAFLL